MSFTPPKDVPYQGCVGKWVPGKNFPQTSSFGYFVCNYCKKNWISARAMKGYKQGCKGCERQFYAAYMWLNDKRQKNQDKDVAKIDVQKSHMSDLCQACRKNRCKYGNNTGKSFYPRRNYYYW